MGLKSACNFLEKENVYTEEASKSFSGTEISTCGVLRVCYTRKVLRDNKHCLKQTNQRSHNHEDDNVENKLKREFQQRGTSSHEIGRKMV